MRLAIQQIEFSAGGTRRLQALDRDFVSEKAKMSPLRS